MKVDYWTQYYDVIANPRWRSAANMWKSLCHYVIIIRLTKSERNYDKMIGSEFKFENSRWRTVVVKENIVFSHNSAASCPTFVVKSYEDAKSENNHGRVWKFSNFKNSRWWKIAILIIVITQYFSEISSYFDQILWSEADQDNNENPATKSQTF